jgi:hypothetical protein
MNGHIVNNDFFKGYIGVIEIENVTSLRYGNSMEKILLSVTKGKNGCPFCHNTIFTVLQLC